MEMLPITTSLEPAIRAGLDELAAERGVSSAEYAAEAIRRAVESDQDYRAFIQVGIDAADRGDLVPHEQVMAELDVMIAEHRAKCREQE